MQDANAEQAAPARAVDALVPAGIVAVVGVTSWLAFRVEQAGERTFWVLAAAPPIALAVASLLVGRRARSLWGQLRPRAGDFSLGFFAAGGLFAAAYAFVKGVLPDGSPRAMWLARIYLQTGDPAALRAHPALLLLGLIVVAAAEEIVWRGVVTSSLATRLGAGRAWLASACLYALALVPTRWSLRTPSAGLDPLLPVAALGMGLVWGGIVAKVERLPPVIVAHALFDWAVLVMFRLWGQSL